MGFACNLAADLHRYLDHQPVVARPPSVGYRLAKSVRRNRAGVTAASLVFVALVVGLVATWTEYRRAEDHKRIAEAQRTRAENEAEQAEAARQEEEAGLPLIPEPGPGPA